MKTPWMLYAWLAALGLPLGAALLRPRRLTAPRRWILLWCGFLLAANLLMLALAHARRNNHRLTYIVIPIAGGVALWALSLWQTSAFATLWIRLLVPLLLVGWVVIVLAVENTTTFSLVADPFAGLVVLGAASYTLVARALNETGRLVEQDWLWIGLGLALSSGTAVALTPMSHWLVARHPELVVKAYEVKAVVEIVALLAITRGVMCPAMAATETLGPWSQYR